MGEQIESGAGRPPQPFDVEKLERLLEEAGIDLLIATSRHNVRYLLGSYSLFHGRSSAVGVDRHLQVVGLRAGSVPDAFAVTSEIDRWQYESDVPWVPSLLYASAATQAAEIVASELGARGVQAGTVGLELAHVPHQFVENLRRHLPHARFADASPVLEELRAVKSERELALLREAAEAIVASIAVAARRGHGVTTRELARRLQREEEERGLGFEYCLVAAGPSYERVPSTRLWGAGDVLSLDSGGEKDGYIGDLCRMAVAGTATPVMREVLDEIRAVQAAARRAITPGATGEDLYGTALDALGSCPHAENMRFIAHGMGLVAHEVPRLTDSGPFPYPATHKGRPLEAGMVLSIETDAKIEGLGFVKLEDTVAVTSTGWEAFGDDERDWIEVS